MPERFAPHESFELHELLTFKNLCVTKSSLVAGLAGNEELQRMLQDDVTVGKTHIRELRDLVQKAESSVSSPSYSM